MYIRYRKGLRSDAFEVRDVRHFCVYEEPDEVDDGVKGFSVCDAGMEFLENFANEAIEYRAALALAGTDRDFFNIKKKCDDKRVCDWTWEHFHLQWFRTREAAQAALLAICQALDAGKQYFDLTLYDENGKLE